MPGPEVLTRDDDIDVIGIFSALKRRWWVILLVSLAAAAALIVILSMISPRYESTARILVRDGNTAFTRATNDASGRLGLPRFDEEAVRSEVEVLQSNNLLFRVIDELELSKLEEFKGETAFGDVRNRVLKLAGQEDRIEPVSRTPTETERRNQTLRMIKERLNVYAVEKSRVIVVEFWSNNPELAQLVVSSLSQKYISLKKKSEIRDSETAAVWLDPKIKELEQDVIATEAAVAEFRANSDLLRTDNNNALLATQQLSQVSTELSRLKAQRSSAQAKVDSIRAALENGSSLDVIPEVIASPLIQRLREREVALLAQVSDLSTTLLPNHPRLKALNSQLRDFQAQIRSAAQNIVTSLENNVDLTRKAEADLENEIERLKAEAARVDEKLVELRALEREAEAAKSLLREYKSRSLEVKSRSGLSQVDAEIISPASLPDKPYFPKIVPFTLAGTFAALMLSTLGVIAASLLTTVNANVAAREPRQEPVAAYEPDTSAENLGADAPPIAPDIAEDKKADTEPAKKTAENMFPVRFGAKAMQKLDRARISVLSPGGDEGSLVSCILARKLAASGETVVLVDLSGGGLCTEKMLGQTDLPGLFNLIDGTRRASSVIYRDRQSAASVVPAGAMFSDPTGEKSNLLPDYVDAIADSFDYCIVDCGDANVEEAGFVSEKDAVFVLSCLRAASEQIESLETELHAGGFREVIRLLPDQEDMRVEQEAA